jgi:hypothetical protein
MPLFNAVINVALILKTYLDTDFKNRLHAIEQEIICRYGHAN